MKVIIFGGSGFIGKYLTEKFDAIKAVRDVNQMNPKSFYWNPMTGMLDPKELEGADAVINVAGDNIATFFWTKKKKENLYESRIRTTALIAQTIAKMDNPPKYLFNASAVGYYGDRGDEVLNEASSPGVGFLPSLCVKWEKTAATASPRTKVVFLRFGMVLDKRGGMLQKLLIPFRFGLGGKLGSGRQWMSWVALEEIEGIIRHVIEKNLVGPINVTSPSPVQNREFAKDLCETLHRPALLNLPKNVLHALFGDLADEMLLASAKAMPQVLIDTGYLFKFSDLKETFDLMGEAPGEGH